MDDEYFRDMLSFRGDADTTAAEETWLTALRSLARPERARFRRRFFETISEGDAFTAAGIFIGRAARYRVDCSRLDRVIRRLTRGLYLKKYGRRLPPGYSVWARTLAAIDPTPEVMTAMEKVVKAAAETSPSVIGEGVFSYWHLPAANDARSGVWFYVFYERSGFVAVTTPTGA